jgi:hypothetical protein
MVVRGGFIFFFYSTHFFKIENSVEFILERQKIVKFSQLLCRKTTNSPLMLFSFYHGKFNIWLYLELFYFILKIPCQTIVNRIFNEIIYFPSQ